MPWWMCKESVAKKNDSVLWDGGESGKFPDATRDHTLRLVESELLFCFKNYFRRGPNSRPIATVNIFAAF